MGSLKGISMEHFFHTPIVMILEYYQYHKNPLNKNSGLFEKQGRRELVVDKVITICQRRWTNPILSIYSIIGEVGYWFRVFGQCKNEQYDSPLVCYYYEYE